MTNQEIKEILASHGKWLRCEGGQRANLNGANLYGANLDGANLDGANLDGANLYGANLTRANLYGANLIRANLTRANLDGAYLDGASLDGATMPDGRVWEDYKEDHMAGLCDNPEVRARAISAWGSHRWGDCPMSAAHGVRESTGLIMSAWVALYDARLLSKPER
jgi:hypothetical protein